MPALLLRFAIVLENSSIAPHDPLSGERRHGPLFHKWLPDGERDGLDLNVDETDAELRVWFEQNGFVEMGRVKFDYERKELDARIISEHPVLDAGPLIGMLRLSNVPEDVLEAIQDNRAGDSAYVAFGRRVVQLLTGPLTRFLDVLRTNYGQYWISELKDWNPRDQNLGSFFSLVIQTKWSIDEGVTWGDFLPEAPEFFGAGRGATVNYDELLTRLDWRELQKTLSEGYEPKLGARLLTSTHELIEREDLRGAAIQGMMALQVALNEFMQRKTRMNKVLGENLQAFASLPLPARLAAVSTLSGAISAQQVESALKLADMHHKIIREGWEPPATARKELENGLLTVAALLPGPGFKFPSYFTDTPVIEAPHPEPVADDADE